MFKTKEAGHTTGKYHFLITFPWIVLGNVFPEGWKSVTICHRWRLFVQGKCQVYRCLGVRNLLAASSNASSWSFSLPFMSALSRLGISGSLVDRVELESLQHWIARALLKRFVVQEIDLRQAAYYMVLKNQVLLCCKGSTVNSKSECCVGLQQSNVRPRSTAHLVVKYSWWKGWRKHLVEMCNLR